VGKNIELMIVGAQKSGTTSLMEYMSQHPSISMSTITEFGYFIHDDQYKKPDTEIFDMYFEKDHLKPNSILCAKSAATLMSHVALERMYEHNPDMQLVVLLRNPVERAYSLFWYNKRLGHESSDDFSDLIRREELNYRNEIDAINRSYLDGGKYIEYLKDIYSIFPQNQVHIYQFEEFKSNPEKVCKELFTTLNLDITEDIELETTKNHNRGGVVKYPIITKIINSSITQKFTKLIPYKLRKKLDRTIRSSNIKDEKYPEMTSKDREYLRSYFNTYNEKLENQIGINVKNWK